ncbi:alpha/beta fold hydrolase [Mobilitalea sibirica]|uniref:Alpha/beta fold hydrolase n=1 Tax=Mobilitalea sibirica TaxID=1462919 RepID=A0A8J7HCD0_9FIRM|nr:alpha/beta fold hydrolase [Mobilitalea sibirica]MBH1939934.1 alpha/beta fold hydrolase [Mobilitalea sibirica]
MKDYTKLLPPHTEKHIGENDLFLEIYEGKLNKKETIKRPPLLFVHGAYTGSWMWSKYIPLFIEAGWRCYVMNLRSHYKSRVMDMTRISFGDYIEDIKEISTLVREECGKAPIVIGFSLGGILCQKLAETERFSGMVLIDSCISREVNKICPYEDLYDNTLGDIVPAPERSECSSMDETEEDIIFQRKYLSIESSKAFLSCGCWIKGIDGISVDSRLIACPALVIKSVNSTEDDRRGLVEAKHLNGEYTGFWNTTHTGLLVGQRYMEIVNRILEWLNRN